MTKRAVLAFASNYGCTSEIANEMAKVLEKEGIKTVRLDLKMTKATKLPSEIEFQGVIIGSGVKINKWIKEARAFIERNAQWLKDSDVVLGLYVCSAFAIVDRDKARKDYLEDVAEGYGLKPDLYEAFPGLLDFSKDSKMGFVDKKMLKLAAKGIAKETGIEFDEKGRNDLRDWDEIREFAGRFAQLMLSR
jgi:menaquinone-dependent protoporphyrinogen IX oxidase